jgi:hypothetical protein
VGRWSPYGISCDAVPIRGGAILIGMHVNQGSIQVATLNVCGLPSSALPPLPERAVEFCRHLDESDIDVVNLQEVWGRGKLELFRARLPSFPYVAWRRGMAGQPAGGLATFSRVPLGAVAYTSFRGAVPSTGGARFRAKRAVYSFLQGALTVELAGRGVVVANTHLTANKDGVWSSDNRYHVFQRRQLAILHAALTRPEPPTPNW